MAKNVFFRLTRVKYLKGVGVATPSGHLRSKFFLPKFLDMLNEKDWPITLQHFQHMSEETPPNGAPMKYVTIFSDKYFIDALKNLY